MTYYSMLFKFHTFREVHASGIIFSHALLQNLTILVMVTYIKASKDCSKRILMMWPPDLHCIIYIALWVYILKNKDPNWEFLQWCHRKTILGSLKYLLGWRTFYIILYKEVFCAMEKSMDVKGSSCMPINNFYV